MNICKDCKLEFFVNPIGIDIKNPRFFWTLEDSRRGASQSAYQIVVRSESEVVWDSGKIQSSETTHIEYAGKDLQPRTRYFWNVKAWNEKGIEGTPSEENFFETGLIDNKLWDSAQWIGDEFPVCEGNLRPVPALRRSFVVKPEIIRARIYATSLGVYEMYCNGKRVGDAYFAPGWTDYDKRVQYQTYDVTSLLNNGENVIGALIGTGWYCGEITGGYWSVAVKKQPLLKSLLIIEYKDGSHDTIVTDNQWKWSLSSILHSDIYMGESIDARQELTNWNTTKFDDSKWGPVVVAKPKCGNIIAQQGPAVRNTHIVRPKWVKQMPNGSWIVDMGQNMVGWAKIRVKAPSGTAITIRHAERLNSDGTLYTINYRRAKSLMNYTCSGCENSEMIEPHFTFFGFQYLEITGYPGIVEKEMITGIVLHSDMEQTGSFYCSDSLVSQLYQNIVWGQRGNYLDIPTDCPQRDERLGWTGDAQVFIRTASYNYQIGGFFTKWLNDLDDAQTSDGRYPHFAPRMSDQGGGASAWADAGIICPWVLYTVYGDKKILDTHYDSMKKWMDYQELYKNSDIKDYAWLGDWLNINAETPRVIIATAFFAYTSHLMSKVATVLGKTADAKYYNSLYERVKKSFNDEFVSPNGRIVGNTQTAYLLALQFDLLPEEKRNAAVQYLVGDIRSRNYKLSSGFVGSPYINLVLSKFNRNDIAYQLLHQTDWPSWLYAVTKGATTIWERWDGWTEDKGYADPGMNSFNHYAYGAIGEWLFTNVAGITCDDSAPAFKRINIAPHPGGKLYYANASYKSINGEIKVNWDIEKESLFILKITVPANTTARVRIPSTETSGVVENGKRLAEIEGVSNIVEESGAVLCDVKAGTYCFSSPFNQTSV